jgi:alpha-L-rhamnosidase
MIYRLFYIRYPFQIFKMKTLFILSLLLCLIIQGNSTNITVSGITPANLKCENLSSPEAIDIPYPRLSWQLTSKERNQKQSAYQIIVSDDPGILKRNTGNYWDSGKVLSDGTLNIPYNGKVLHSGDHLYWKVRVWDKNGMVSEWSNTESWGMSLLSQDEWKAKWIGKSEDLAPDSAVTGPAPYFRKEFNLKNGIKSAHVYVSGLGFYELYFNGQKTGDEVLAPAQTNYDSRKLNKLLYFYDDQSTQRVHYNTFDVTSQLKKGKNAVGIVLGNGWYNQRDRTVEGCLWYSTPRLIMQLEITYLDGKKELVISDESWKVTTGPLLHDGIFTGEVYDARLELAGWNLADYNDADWENAQLVRIPEGELVSQMAPPDRIMRSIQPISVTKTGTDTYLYDAGEMISGWVQLKISGDRGTQIKIRHIEELGRDYGQTDTYILKGKGIEIYEPRFTWHAFRTFEISGINNPVPLTDVIVKVVNTDVLRTGEFECSNQLFNKIYDNYLRTQEGNFHGSISSDCPHRERLGYTGDGQVVVESSIFNFDMTQFYQKWFDDMDDARNKKTGYVPHTVPFGGGGGGPAWGSAYVIMPWNYYLYYNDKQILEHHYNGMKQWVLYLGTRTDSSGIVIREEPNGWCLGDWATPAKIQLPESLVNTCYYYRVTDIMSEVADILGKNEDEEFFIRLADKIKDDFNRKFFNDETGNYWEGRQGANVFPLVFGMVPEENRSAVLQNLVAGIKKNGDHLDTGILGTPLLLEVLSKNGLSEIAFKIMNQPDFPGFGYYINGKNATTLWEDWDGKSSHSHPMYGSVIGWFFKSLAGINLQIENSENHQFIIKPVICGDLSFVKASYNSIRGKISSEWKKVNRGIEFNIEIPANTSATVYLPANPPGRIEENGTQISENKSILSVKTMNDMTVLEIGSGSYQFLVQNQ